MNTRYFSIESSSLSEAISFSESSIKPIKTGK